MAGPKRKAKKTEDLWDDDELDKREDEWIEDEEERDKYCGDSDDY